jgi:SRSO17 transposase
MAEACGGGGDLDRWLAPFLEVLGHKKRRTWAPLYLRGLLGPGERKSLQPMAARLGLPGHDQLHHFVTSPAWDDGPLWAALAREADRLVGGPEAVLVIDDTALPKKGELSAGVARQYCGQLGKKANCQALVSLTLARGEVPVPVALRLFLPDEWTRDPTRCARAGVPTAAMVARSKGAIALAELDRVLAAGLRFGIVLADTGYGTSAAFRHGLDARRLLWAVGIPRTQKAYTTAVRLRWPRARTGRPRKTPVPSEEPRSAEDVLAGARWRRLSWRRGTKGALAAPRARWPRASPPSGCASPTAGRTARAATCRARRPGWWASGAPAASASSTSAICRPGRRCATWRPRSRRAGPASRRISS